MNAITKLLTTVFSKNGRDQLPYGVDLGKQVKTYHRRAEKILGLKLPFDERYFETATSSSPAVIKSTSDGVARLGVLYQHPAVFGQLLYLFNEFTLVLNPYSVDSRPYRRALNQACLDNNPFSKEIMDGMQQCGPIDRIE